VSGAIARHKHVRKQTIFAHPQSKEWLLKIAEEYDRLAQHAEEWQMARKQE